VAATEGSRLETKAAGALEHGAHDAERGAEDVEEKARREERRAGYRRLARAGLVARGIVYLVIGGLTLDIAAAGRAPSGPDSRGAFAEIARQPGGRVLLSVLAVGLLAYASWRVVQFAAGAQGGEDSQSGRDSQDDDHRWLGVERRTWQRIGWLASGAAYAVLFAEALEILLGSSTSSSGGERPEPFVASVLRSPGGPGWIGLLGIGIAAGGVALGVWGVVHRYEDVLRFEQMSAHVQLAARSTGIAGDLARGCSILLVAAYAVAAAVTNDPAQARAVDAALQSLVGVPGGRELLGLIGAGMLAFAVYSVFEARYRRL
jgi:hypothetical protein